jgi:hypothetical protein
MISNNATEYNNITSTISSITNSNGTIYNGFNSNTNSESNIPIICKDNDDTFKNNIAIAIFRYKFDPNFTEELYKFSKIHQYDHRKDFKNAWETWVEENDTIIKEEIERLNNLNYEGNILDKMFKSARYYFRKKSTEKKDPKERKSYISVQKELLTFMDEHIKRSIQNENYKPSEGFDTFCKENVDLLKEEVNILCKNGFTNSDEIKKKIKKTYKNRYFLLIKESNEK